MLNFLTGVEVFEVFGYTLKEEAAQCAVDDPVVASQRQVHHVADANGVTIRCFYNHWLLLDQSHTEDAHLGLVDDGGAHGGAKRAEVGQGEGAALDLIRLQLIAPRLPAKSLTSLAMPEGSCDPHF